MNRLDRLEAWLDADRVRFFSRALALAQGLLLGFFIAGTHGWLVAGVGPNTTDFVSFYAAGTLANAGTPALAYDQTAHLAAEEKATEKGIGYEYFFYPPTFLLLCAPLARLPYLVSFVLFEAATLAAWLALTRRIAGPGSVAPLLACSSVWWTLGIGQNALLSGTIMAAATLMLSRRPAVSGIVFAAQCFKPHLGLLVPVALLARRQYRAFAAATVTLAAFMGASVLLLGVETWRRFLAVERMAPTTLYSGKVALAAHIDMRGGAMLLGLDPSLAGGLQIVVTILALLAALIIWRRGDEPTRAAALAAGTLAIIPFALFYDLILATVAGAWLVQAGRETGFLRGEKTILALCVVADLITYPVGKAAHLPFGVLIAPALLGLCYRRAARSKKRETSFRLA